MPDAYKTPDLGPNERAALERLLGRTLRNDEAVEITTRKIDDVQREHAARRKQAVARIRELAKGKTLGGATVRDLIDEGRRF